MNEESIKKYESKLFKAYKEGNYGETLQRMLGKRPEKSQSINDTLRSLFG